jgi:rare lipoprotein A
MGLKNIIYVAFGLCIGGFSTQAQTESSHRQQGKASYYASKFQGRKTASGEKYNSQEMTAAHPQLPFNTLVRVTNPANGHSCIVRINDRGPFSHNRMIDVSHTAAQELGIIKAGSALVHMEVVSSDGKPEQKSMEKEWMLAEEKRKEEGEARRKTEAEALAMERKQLEIKKLNEETRRAAEETARLSSADNYQPFRSYGIQGTEKSPQGYGVQVGTYTSLEKARETAKKLLQNSIHEVYIQVIRTNGEKVYSVLAGAFDQKKIARNFAQVVQKAGYNGLVKRHLD